MGRLEEYGTDTSCKQIAGSVGANGQYDKIRLAVETLAITVSLAQDSVAGECGNSLGRCP